MPSKWNTYRVEGTVEIQYDDIVADSPEGAIKTCKWLKEGRPVIEPEVYKNFNLNAEFSRAMTKEEVIDGFGEEEWED